MKVRREIVGGFEEVEGDKGEVGEGKGKQDLISNLLSLWEAVSTCYIVFFTEEHNAGLR